MVSHCNFCYLCIQILRSDSSLTIVLSEFRLYSYKESRKPWRRHLIQNRLFAGGVRRRRIHFRHAGGIGGRQVDQEVQVGGENPVFAAAGKTQKPARQPGGVVDASFGEEFPLLR